MRAGFSQHPVRVFGKLIEIQREGKTGRCASARSVLARSNFECTEGQREALHRESASLACPTSSPAKVGRNTVTSGGPVTVTVTEPIPCYRSREGILSVCLARGSQRRSCYRSRGERAAVTVPPKKLRPALPTSSPDAATVSVKPGNFGAKKNQEPSERLQREEKIQLYPFQAWRRIAGRKMDRFVGSRPRLPSHRGIS